MAIIVREKEERRMSFFPLLVGAFILIVVGGAVYFLFFAPTPFIEKISPTAIQDVSEITTTVEDPSAILTDPVFTSLRRHIPNPEVGQLGRPNPFLTF